VIPCIAELPSVNWAGMDGFVRFTSTETAWRWFKVLYFTSYLSLTQSANRVGYQGSFKFGLLDYGEMITMEHLMTCCQTRHEITSVISLITVSHFQLPFVAKGFGSVICKGVKITHRWTVSYLHP